MKDEIERVRAAWGFQNRTDIVTLAGGEQVVVQHYRRREDAEHRLRVMRTLGAPAADAGIAIPGVLESDLDADTPWVVFEALPGEPVAAGGDAAIAALARPMGELLAAFRALPADGLELDNLWADPVRLAARAAEWAEAMPPALEELLDRVPALFAGRPAVLAHGDFAPVNVLTDGSAITGLLDFESVRLADPLFDAAWWAWSVSFTSAFEKSWPRFLAGAGLDADAERIRALQVLRMLELIAERRLAPEVHRIVVDKLRTELG